MDGEDRRLLSCKSSSTPRDLLSRFRSLTLPFRMVFERSNGQASLQLRGKSHRALDMERQEGLGQSDLMEVRAFSHGLLKGCEGCVSAVGIAIIIRTLLRYVRSLSPFLDQSSPSFSSPQIYHVVRQLPTPLSLARRCHCLEHRHFTVLAAWVHLLSLPQWTVPLLQLPRVSSSTV